MQRSLDGFELIELIGFGGTGEVWRARPDGGGPDVALKWLTAETVDTDLLSGCGLRDFEHPHVARLLDLCRDGSSVVLVQEFIAGVSLAALLREREKLSSAEVVTLLMPVAEALGAAHDVGLLHGSLTPSAVLLTADGRPVLTDLGIARCLGAAPTGTAGLGYLDPCVTRGAEITAASDVFGVAAIGFHALTGRAPWAADNSADTWQVAAEGMGVDIAPLHARVPARLAQVIARGLSEQADRRGSALDFAADIRDCLEPEPLQLDGPYLWPDLPPTEESDSAAERPVRLDIAGEVRRGNSARHAATPGAPRRGARVLPRRAVVGALLALGILAAVVLGLGWNASRTVPAQAGGPLGAASDTSAAGEPGAESDATGSGIDERAVPDSPEAWVALLGRLYERRALAFGTGAVELLDLVFTADSPQLAVDVAEVTRLVSAGEVLRGFTPRVLSVSAAVVDGDQAMLQITDEFPDYETVPALDSAAGALANHAGRGPTAVAMTLVRTEQGWRIHSAQRLA